jgi:hypothetical protein
MSLDEYFHVGIVVPDIHTARDRFTELLGVAWGPVMVNDIEVRDGDGERTVPNTMCYSTTAPYLELIQEVAGTPWVCNEYSNLHHIGFFTDALADETTRLGAARCPLEMMDGTGDGPPWVWAYHRDPLGVRVEIVNTEMRPMMEQFMWRVPEE